MNQLIYSKDIEDKMLAVRIMFRDNSFPTNWSMPEYNSNIGRLCHIYLIGKYIPEIGYDKNAVTFSKKIGEDWIWAIIRTDYECVSLFKCCDRRDVRLHEIYTHHTTLE